MSPNKQVVLEKKSKDVSPLSKILRKRSRFKSKYFEDIDKTRKNMNRVHLRELEPIQIGEWTVRPLMGKDNILVRASNGTKEFCRKYLLCDDPSIVETYYKDWLKQKFEWMN